MSRRARLSGLRRPHRGAGATPSTLGAVTATAALDGGVELLHEGGRQRVRFLEDGILEVRIRPSGTFHDRHSFGLDPAARWAGPTRFQLGEQHRGVVAASPALRAVIDKASGRVTVSHADATVLTDDAAPPTWYTPERDLAPSIVLAKKLRPAERLLGLGDKAAAVDRRGHRFEHWNTDAYGFERGSDPLYKSIPFLLALPERARPYGLFVDSVAPSIFDLGKQKKGEMRVAVEDDELSYYVLSAGSPLGVVERFAALSGRTPMLPKWALGYHQCRYSYASEDDMRRVAHELRTRRIPCDLLYFDIHYMDSFRMFTWDRRAFPNPEILIEDLHDDGFTTVAIVDPGISVKPPDDEVLRDGVANDVFLRYPQGRLFEGPVWPGRCHFPDFMRTDVRAWWGRNVRDLVSAGLDGLWCDMNEPSVFVEQVTGGKVPQPQRTIPDEVVHHLDGEPVPHRRVHNAYGQQMQRATYDGLLRARPNRRPFTITRAAYAGSQRFGTTWTGDNSATWDQLRLGLEQCLSLNVSGFPFCGMDIGGFSGTPTGELMARWTQAGVLTPLFRNHSSVDTPRQEPWLFGKKIEDACRKAIELRYRLLPYLYTALYAAASKGTPIMRPLELMHPDDAVVARKKFFGMYLGEDLLAYPVLAPRVRRLKVYLPEVPGGWFDFHTGERRSPGVHKVQAPLDHLPLFARAGSVIPLGPVVQTTAHLGDHPLTLRVFPHEGRFESRLYEDAGDGWDHEAGRFLLCTFTAEASHTGLDMRTRVEGALEAPWRHLFVEIVGSWRRVEQVLVDGVETEFERDELGVRCEMRLGAALWIRHA